MPRAHDLANRYHDVVTAMRAAHAFDRWLDRHWLERCPEPASEPTACTVVDPEGTIVEWYEVDGAVFGYVAGYEGCYRLALAAPIPDPAGRAPGRHAAADEDVVIDLAYGSASALAPEHGWADTPADRRPRQGTTPSVDAARRTVVPTG